MKRIQQKRTRGCKMPENTHFYITPDNFDDTIQ